MTEFVIIEENDPLDQKSEVDYFLKAGWKIIATGQYAGVYHDGNMVTVYWTHITKEISP